MKVESDILIDFHFENAESKDQMLILSTCDALMIKGETLLPALATMSR